MKPLPLEVFEGLVADALDEVHLPGIFVQHVVPLTEAQGADKHIERRTTRAADHREES